VPCIHCGEYQELLKGDPEDPWGLHWAKDANGEHRPETAEYWCKANGCVMTWADNHVIQQRGRWVARNPGHPIAGFTMSGLNSTMPGANWEKLAAEFIEAKKAQEKGNREPLKKFVTTVLAEVYADKGETLKDYELATHLRIYDPNGVAEIPADTGRLLASVDVQKNWLKYHVWAWCKDARFALVECDYIRTDPTLDSTWDTLTAALNRPFKTRNPNKPLYVAAIAVDAGYALHKRKTEEWVVKSATLARPVIGIKGRSTAGKGRLLDQPAQSKLGNYMPWLIDTHAAKEIIYEKFKVGDGPGYVSLPQWLDPDEIAQFTAEERKETVRGGRKVFEWVKIGNRRNENLDLFVYVLALTELFGIGGQMQVDKWAELELALVGVGPVTGSQAVPNAPINANPAAIQAPIPPPQPVNPPLQRGIPHRIIPMSRTPRY
jgi:phage terminase large subunit GpA-like protein